MTKWQWFFLGGAAVAFTLAGAGIEYVKDSPAAIIMVFLLFATGCISAYWLGMSKEESTHSTIAEGEYPVHVVRSNDHHSVVLVTALWNTPAKRQKFTLHDLPVTLFEGNTKQYENGRGIVAKVRMTDSGLRIRLSRTLAGPQEE